MNIKILDSWLREYLNTDAKPKELAEKLSLTSVSIERIEKYNDDYLYDVEITTNRPDLMSVVGLAREASAVLPQFGIKAELLPPKTSNDFNSAVLNPISITIKNDPKLVNRICAVVMDVSVKDSPQYVKDRLESSGIRSLNNLIDITNYVMRTIGHPTHVFDYDRFNPKNIVVRESKKGEKIVTLDKKEYILPGGDIVADNGKGTIIDLLGVMGLENSVVTNDTKRIIFFVDNNDPVRMRRTSMSLALRSEAVQMNEKGVDPELAYEALLYGIGLYEKFADGNVVSDIIDIYPNKPTLKKITVPEKKITTIMGVTIPLHKAADLLQNLGFHTLATEREITVEVPSFRAQDVIIQEDVIEEIARVYGYHNLPSELPPVTSSSVTPRTNDEYYWEKRIKNAMKYWGYIEVYTYSMVSEDMYEGPLEDAVTIKNPLSEEWVYMRRSLVPSMLKVLTENKKRKTIRIFEIANIYEHVKGDIPKETRIFAGVIKKPHVSFFEVKGLLEQLGRDIGISHMTFMSLDQGSREIEIRIGKESLGVIGILDDDLIDFELDFEKLVRHASERRTYIPLPKYPPVIEDLAFLLQEDITTGDVITTIQHVDKRIADVSLLDRYKDTRTFHILYQDREKNLSNEDAGKIREKIIAVMKEKFNARTKP